MKERPILFSGAMVRALLDGGKTQTRRVIKTSGVADAQALGPKAACCPYGEGQHLWVRESFWGCDMPGYGDQPCVVYEDEWHGKEYRAAEVRPYARRFGHIPGIHMPRDASRILLEVTDVRVERLQDISENDAWAEGCPEDATWALDWYQLLWNSLNAARGYGWDVNPYVWVVEFKRIKS